MNVHEIYERKSRFQTLFNGDYSDFAYETRFISPTIRLLENKGVEVPEGFLDQLHLLLSPELRKYNFDDGVNAVSALMYEQDEYFITVYHAFIKEIREYFPPFYFQATPTIRIQCPGENNNHYPRWHTDIAYGHSPNEINIWIPLTAPQIPQGHGFSIRSVFNSNAALWVYNYDFEKFIKNAIENKAYSNALFKDSISVQTMRGKFFAFDSRCIHTSAPLLNHTRVSIDIRIIPIEDFKAQKTVYQGTGRRKIRYIPGEGYYPLSSEEL